jgi:S1-C subfamily serine protease
MIALPINPSVRIAHAVITPIVAMYFTVIPCLAQSTNDHIFLSARIDDALSGVGARDAYDSVMRLFCTDKNTFGSAFLHTKNEAITAAHVVKDCTKLVILAHDGTQIPCTVRASDDDLDIAVVTLQTAVDAAPLKLAADDDVAIGTEVSA